MSYQQAIQMLQQGSFQQAREMLHALPLDFHTANLLGIVGQLLQDWTAAKESWIQASAFQPENVDVRLNLGVACMALGEKEEAAAWWRTILDIESKHPQSLINLGLFHREREENQQAHDYWVQALELLPENMNVREWLADVKGLLGIGLLVLGRVSDAESYLKEAVLLDPNYPILWGYMSEWHFEQREFGEALATCNRAIELDENNSQFFHTRGNILRAFGDDASALKAYQTAVQLGGNHISTRRAIAELTDQFIEEDTDVVEMLFDQYASKFDHHLQENLKYDVPQKARQLMNSLKGREGPFANLLDLGCGTGLSMQPFLDLTTVDSQVIGVDLSQNMLHQAEKKGVYTDLVHSSFVDFLNQTVTSFDLVLCLDTLVYCADLKNIFQQIMNLLSLEGFAIFSTERSEVEDVALQRTGRYAHSIEYVSTILNELGFSVSCVNSTELRKDGARWVLGNIWIVQKK